MSILKSLFELPLLQNPIFNFILLAYSIRVFATVFYDDKVQKLFSDLKNLLCHIISLIRAEFISPYDRDLRLSKVNLYFGLFVMYGLTIILFGYFLTFSTLSIMKFGYFEHSLKHLILGLALALGFLMFARLCKVGGDKALYNWRNKK